ncbi:MAG TPA: hypothetical protein VGP72_31715 [Planctomycetota bacterium]
MSKREDPKPTSTTPKTPAKIPPPAPIQPKADTLGVVSQTPAAVLPKAERLMPLPTRYPPLIPKEGSTAERNPREADESLELKRRELDLREAELKLKERELRQREVELPRTLTPSDSLAKILKDINDEQQRKTEESNREYARKVKELDDEQRKKTEEVEAEYQRREAARQRELDELAQRRAARQREMDNIARTLEDMDRERKERETRTALEENARALRDLQSKQTEPCLRCRGTGNGILACYNCNGRRFVFGMACVVCKGRGFSNCMSCNGTGLSKY